MKLSEGSALNSAYTLFKLGVNCCEKEIGIVPNGAKKEQASPLNLCPDQKPQISLRRQPRILKRSTCLCPGGSFAQLKQHLSCFRNQ